MDGLIPIKYILANDVFASNPVTFDRIASGKWAVRNMGNCLNKSGEWEFEPSPSSRTDAFLKRCRFDSLEEAKKTYEKTK